MRSGDLVSFVSSEARRRGISEERIQTWANSLPVELVEAANRGEFNGSLFSHSLLYPQYWTDSLNIDTPTAESKWRALVLVLEEFVRECRSRNLSLGLVYLPTPLQYDPKRFEPSNPMVLSGMIVDEQWLTTQSELQQRIAAWAHSNSVAHLDLTPFFREQIKEQPTLNWPLDGHWTRCRQPGHRCLAGGGTLLVALILALRCSQMSCYLSTRLEASGSSRVGCSRVSTGWPGWWSHPQKDGEFRYLLRASGTP